MFCSILASTSTDSFSYTTTAKTQDPDQSSLSPDIQITLS